MLTLQEISSQPLPIEYELLPVHLTLKGKVETDDLYNAVLISKQTVSGKSNAPWIRAVLSKSTYLPGERGLNASYIKVISVLDGHYQILDAISIVEWGFASAYFNGVSVVVELWGYSGQSPSTRVDSVVSGARPTSSSTKSLCGPDSRTLSSYRKSGRYLGSGGCTGNIINDKRKCILTAEHCGRDSITNGGVIQFQVPLSQVDGSMVHPHPDHQYSMDPSSIIEADKYFGNDWLYGGAFPNSNTLKTIFEVQQDAYVLSTNKNPPPFNTTLRIVGYGVVEDNNNNNGVPESHRQVQKEAFGPYAYDKKGETNGVPKWEVFYRVDATGGNSGSAVTDDRDGTLIAIHAYAGCSTWSGENSGTFLYNPPLQEALQSPKGVCA